MSAPQPDDERGRVLPFRPREKPRATGPQKPVEGLGKYGGGDQPDDYRRRMINNALAFSACIVLVAIGIWIATTMADMRRKQDCVLSGRRDCANVSVPADPK